MRLIPRKRVVLKTSLSAEELNTRIRSITSAQKLFTFQYPKDGRHIFCGEVGAEEFRIHRIIHYRNSFLPILIGRIHEIEDGTELELLFRLHRFVLVFMIVWFTGTIPAFFVATAAIIVTLIAESFEPMLLVGLVLAPFGLALVNIPFWIEARIAEDKLRESLGLVEKDGNALG